MAPLAYPQLKPLEANSPYSPTMRGKIAVALVVASGPRNSGLAFTTKEYNQVVSEIMIGLDFWEDKAPPNAGLSFALYDWGPTISTQNGRPGCYDASCHDVFAIPALLTLGYSSIDELAQTVKSGARAVGAYIAFVTKYRLHHFAYAHTGGGPLYMQYSNGPWGPDRLAQVFAHESGHVFNAPDEYTNCQCNERYGKGMCTERNTNCIGNDGTAVCTKLSNHQDCIMDTTTLTNVCSYTKKHIGWC